MRNTMLITTLKTIPVQIIPERKATRQSMKKGIVVGKMKGYRKDQQEHHERELEALHAGAGHAAAKHLLRSI